MTNLKKLVVGFAFCAGALLVSAPAAEAATIIGNFDFTVDPLFGDTVTVTNFAASADPFFDIVIDLESTPNGTGLYGYGTVNSGDSPSFIFDYLSQPGFAFSFLASVDFAQLLVDPDAFVRASLTLSYQGIPVTNTPEITVLSPSAPITVPEPATLLLLGSGALVAALRRRRLLS